MRLTRAVAELRALTEHETATDALADLTDCERAEHATTLGQLLTLSGKYLGALGLHLVDDSYADIRACATAIGELERAAGAAHHLANHATQATQIKAVTN